MGEKNEVDRNNDVMLPGFRFHPTDEELVSFYLKRKVQQRPLPIELIKQVDIYKYDPWDLPKLAMTGEKEWYFYCPRDRKYRNSARPNRVTGAGFWKATGTDRPIHSSDGTKCIGLKKSLVFYRGRAAKGMKTDWMMHEFRLPSLGEPLPPKKFTDRSFPANDAWAICKIFKKSHSMAQRALPYSWVSNLTDPTPDMLNQPGHFTPFSSENISYPTETGSFHTCSSFPALDMLSNVDTPNFLFSPVGLSGSTECSVSPSTILNPAMVDASKPSDSEQQFSGFSISFPHTNICSLEVDPMLRKNQSEIDETSKWESAVRSLEFPFSLPPNFPDAWKPHLSSLDSPPCPILWEKQICSRLSSSQGGDQRELESGDQNEEGNSEKVYKEQILVIMAGNHKPTFLATPLSSMTKVVKIEDQQWDKSESRDKVKEQTANQDLTVTSQQQQQLITMN